LVDLAGCDQHQGNDMDTKSQWRFKEGQYINRSLTALHEVVNSVYSKSKRGTSRHDEELAAPRYRSSKLTQLLQEYLNPSEKLIFIVTIDPVPELATQNLAALKFVSALR
jgi:hypothetical protein